MKKSLHHYMISIVLLFTATTFVNNASAQVIHTESFDTTQFLPQGWTAVGTINQWNRFTTGTNPTCTPHSGLGMARFARQQNGGGTLQTFCSPVIDYSNRGVDTPRVSFWIYRDDGADTVADFITIYVNTTPDLTGPHSLGNVYRSRTLGTTVPANGWYQYTYDIPASYNTSVNYILVRGANGATRGNNIFIDDIQYDSYSTPCSGSPAPGHVVASDSVLCGGTGSTTLTLEGHGTETGITFQWKSGASSTGPWIDFGTSVTSLSSGTITSTTYFYCVSTCGNSGLSDSSAVIMVTVDPNAAPVLILTASNNGNFCIGSTPDTLTATGALSYSWSPAGGLNTTTGSIVLASPIGNPGTNTVYTVTGANSSGCTSRDSIQITNHTTSLVTIQATPNDTVCAGQLLVLNATTQGGPNVTSYLWSPTGETTQSISFVPSIDSTYSVHIVNQWGCEDNDSLPIKVVTGSVPTITSITTIPANAVYCNGGNVPVTLIATGIGATAFAWSPNNGLSSTTGDTVYASPQGGGPGGGSVLYTVTLTNSLGCASSDTIRVTRGRTPNIFTQITPNDTVCSGVPVTLNAQVLGFGTYSFLWSPSGDTTQTAVFSPTVNTPYIVHVTNTTSGCANSDTTNVAIQLSPIASFTFLVSQLTATFTNTSVNGISYSWNFGDSSNSAQTNPSHLYNASGNYSVTLIANGGVCTDTIVHLVHVGPIGINELSSDNEISLLPNPTSGMATVQFMPDQSDAVLQIMNSLGQIILERKINAKASKLHKEEIDLSAFPSGVYMIQINTVRKNISRKLIKL